MNLLALEVLQSGDRRPIPRAGKGLQLARNPICLELILSWNNVLQKPLRGDEDICEVLEGRAVMLDNDLPLAPSFLPIRTGNTMIVLHIAVQVPLLCCLLHVLPDFWASGEEPGPIRIWIERKCLPTLLFSHSYIT